MRKALLTDSQQSIFTAIYRDKLPKTISALVDFAAARFSPAETVQAVKVLASNGVIRQTPTGRWELVLDPRPLVALSPIAWAVLDRVASGSKISGEAEPGVVQFSVICNVTDTLRNQLYSSGDVSIALDQLRALGYVQSDDAGGWWTESSMVPAFVKGLVNFPSNILSREGCHTLIHDWLRDEWVRLDSFRASQLLAVRLEEVAR